MKLPDWLKLVKGSLDEDDEPVDLLLAEPIGFDPDTFTGMSSQVFGQALGSVRKGKTVNLLINTLGGSVPEGTAMHNMIVARGNVNTVVIGWAASTGAIVAQAGAKRQMMPGTVMMIHNPSAPAGGDYREVQGVADALKMIKNNIVDLLAARAKIDKREISKMMDDATYLSPKDAKKAGLIDEIVDVVSAWNSLALRPASDAINTFRQAGFLHVKAADVGEQKEQKKSMKLITAALAAAKLIPSADMSDEAGIVAAFNTGVTPLRTAETENVELKNRVKKFEDEQKTRVTAKVDKAITDKLVKAERKEALVNLGVRDEAELDATLADLTAAKGAAAPPGGTRRGAPPVPPVESDEADDTEAKIAELQGKLKTASPEARVVICKQLRELRGHKDLFAAPAAK